MNNRFRKLLVNFWAPILLVVLALWFALRSYPYQQLSIDNYNSTAGFKILGILLIVTLIVERVVEALVTFQKGPERTKLETNITQLKQALDKTPNDQQIEQSLLEAENRKSTIKTETQFFAIAATLVIGLLVSISGFNVLTTFFSNKKSAEKPLVINTAFSQQFEAFKESVSEEHLNLKGIYLKADSNQYLVDENKASQLALAVSQLDSAYQKMLLEAQNKGRTSRKYQGLMFNLIGILVTALLISGGSEPIHKLFSLYDAFMKRNKNAISNPTGNSP